MKLFAVFPYKIVIYVISCVKIVSNSVLHDAFLFFFLLNFHKMSFYSAMKYVFYNSWRIILRDVLFACFQFIICCISLPLEGVLISPYGLPHSLIFLATAIVDSHIKQQCHPYASIQVVDFRILADVLRIDMVQCDA